MPRSVTLPKLTPMDVLKWAAVVFVVALQVLVIVAIVLAMTGYY